MDHRSEHSAAAVEVAEPETRAATPGESFSDPAPVAARPAAVAPAARPSEDRAHPGRWIVALLLVCAVVGGGYWFWSRQNRQNSKTAGMQAAAGQARTVPVIGYG